MEKRKEELASEERKKKHVSENITKVVRCLRRAPAGWRVQFAKEEEEVKEDRERKREGERRERQRKRTGKFSSLPHFVEREPASIFAYYAEL